MKLLLPLLLAGQLVLYGQVSKDQGRIGIRHSTWGRINHVYLHSPAYDAGLKSGDIIKSVNGEEGWHGIRGPVDSEVQIRVRRLRDDIVFTVKRAAESDIRD